MSRLPLWMNPNIACKRLGHNFQQPRFTSSPLPPSLEYAGVKSMSLNLLPDGRVFPVQLLVEKRGFCASVDECSECMRCQWKKLSGGARRHLHGAGRRRHRLNGGSVGCCAANPLLFSSFSSVTSSASNASVLSGGELSMLSLGANDVMAHGCDVGGDSDGCGQHDCACQDSGFGIGGCDSAGSVAAAAGGGGGGCLGGGDAKSTSGASFDTSENSGRNSVGEFEKTCSFCYVHFKKHCQKFDRPWPRIEDSGFWHGHCTKDENGNVECPELFKLMCPLCFATGADAHTLKFCPLNSLSDE